MWPFRSTRDRIEMLREIKKPTPGTTWPWSSADMKPETPTVLPAEHAGARVSANISTGEVEVRWVGSDGELLFGVALSPQQTVSHIAALTRALGALQLAPEPPKSEGVDITKDVEEGDNK